MDDLLGWLLWLLLLLIDEVCRRPQKLCDWLERCRRHFELPHGPSARHFKAGSSTKQQVAK